MEYGVVNGFTEDGDGLELAIDDNDYYSIQPELGIRAEKRRNLGKILSIKLFAEAAYAYELGENYDGNLAKLKKGDAGWYNLITPEEEKGIIKGKFGLTLEKFNKLGITLDVEARKHDNKDDVDVKYNVGLKYIF